MINYLTRYDFIFGLKMTKKGKELESRQLPPEKHPDDEMYAKRRKMHKKKRIIDEAKQLSKEHKKKHIGKKEVDVSGYSRKPFSTGAHSIKKHTRIIS